MVSLSSTRNSLDTAVYNTVYERIASPSPGSGFSFTVPQNTVIEILHLSFEAAMSVVGANREFYLRLQNPVYSDIVVYASDILTAGESRHMFFAQHLPNFTSSGNTFTQTSIPVGFRCDPGWIWHLDCLNMQGADAIGNISLYTKQWVHPQ